MAGDEGLREDEDTGASAGGAVEGNSLMVGFLMGKRS